MSKFSDIPFELNFRNKGKLLTIEIVCNNGELVKILLDLEKELNEYFWFNLVLKTGIYLYPSYDIIEISNLFAFILSVKSETYNVKYFCEDIFKLLKDVKIPGVKILDKMLGYLDLINVSLGTKIKMEYDAKFLAEVGKENLYEKGGEGHSKVSKNLERYLVMLKSLLEAFGLWNLVILDDIKITLFDSRYQNIHEISIKIPGFSKALESLP